jgi:hypothetical protein
MKTLIAGVLLVFSLGGQGLAQCPTKINDYVNASGYKFSVAKPCSMWLISDAVKIPRDGAQGVLLVAEEGEMLIVGTVVQLKAKLDVSAPALLKLMRLNHELDYVKIGIDNDDDLFVRLELHARKVDAADFKAAIATVITAAGKIYTAIK